MKPLSQQARDIADALEEYSAECGALLERALTGAKAGEKTPLHDTARREALFLSLHFLDRIALRNLGFAERELYMNALLSALTARIPVDELRAGYAAVQSRFGKFNKVVPDEGESPEDTLFWEVGKALASDHAALNPVAITLTVKVASDMLIGLSQAFRTTS